MITPDECEKAGGEVAESNERLAPVVGSRLIQFRMGYGIHLELGNYFELTIETSLSVSSQEAEWIGEPLTAEAAGALLPLISREVTSARIEPGGMLWLEFGDVAITVPPHPMYEAWQVRGPRNLLIVCAPGGEYVAVFRPDGP